MHSLFVFPFRSIFMAAPPTAAAAPVQVKERIEVTDTERRIFGRLLEVVRHFSLETQLRIAGGWVRDKKFGTAEEDAYRRGLTINSMFYIINTDLVEDLTGRGARFGFVLDEELKEAAADEEVKAALADKISRECVGHELGICIT